MIRLSGLVLSVTSPLLLMRPASAADNATIHGNVTLWTGYSHHKRGVAVLLRDREGATWDGRTDNKGDYSIVVPIGEYSLSITYASYCRVHRPTFKTRAGDDLRFDFDLLLCLYAERFDGEPGTSITPYKEDVVPITGFDGGAIISYGWRNDGDAETSYGKIRVPRSLGATLPVTIRIGKYTAQGDSARLDRTGMLVTLKGTIFIARGSGREAYAEPCAVFSLTEPERSLSPCPH